MKRIKPIILIFFTVLLLLSGCTNNNTVNTENSATPMYQTMEELHGKSVAVSTGSAQEKMALEYFPDSQILYYASFSECFMAVQQGKAEFTIAPQSSFQGVSESFPSLVWQETPISTTDICFGFGKSDSGERLREQMDEFLSQRFASGEHEKVFNSYYSNPDYGETYDFSTLEGANGTIKIALQALDAPFFRVVDNGYKGVEAELFYLFCQNYGYKAEINLTEFSSIITGITMQKYDSACYLLYTEERAEKINFSTPYASSDQLIIVRTAGYTADSQQSIFDKFIAGIEKNFIRENRWKMVVSGLGVTIGLALGSALLGTFFGALLCALRMSKKTILSKVAAGFIRIIQGIPVLVLLLVLYYIIFSNSSISGVFVGIIAFSVEFGVYVAEIFRSAIGAVDSVQWEAASALGFSRSQSFTKVILPQALRHAMPVYKGQFISMVKMTSIVGYVAVQDLTKVSDIIRAQTYDALMPLLVTALIYFLLSWLLVKFLRIIELRVDPSRRKKVLSGINTDIKIEDKENHQPFANSDEVVIRLEHLRKEYKEATPLEDVNAEIHRGDVISVIGPSGTGKSTLLRCINRMEKPTSGIVELFGEVPKNEKIMCRFRMRTGMVFQSFNLFEHLTVIENIMLAPVSLIKQSKQEAYEKGIALLSKVGLAEKALSYPNELSGGQKQRVAIVRALAMNPEILLLDEPTSALDPTMVGEVLNVISQLAKSGLTMMIVTHEMKFARDVSTRTFYMDQGIIYEDGPSKEMFERPKTELAKAFICRLKIFKYTLNTSGFDFLNLRSELERFALGEMIEYKDISRLTLLTEEVLMNGIRRLPEAAFPGEVNVEYGQDGETSLVVKYKKCGSNPMDYLDDVSRSLIENLAKDISIVDEADETILSMKLA